MKDNFSKPLTINRIEAQTSLMCPFTQVPKIHNPNARSEETEINSLYSNRCPSYVFKEIIQLPYRFLRIFTPHMRTIFFNYNALYALFASFCVFGSFCARYFCIMKGEVGGERRKETQLLFLVAIYGIFFSRLSYRNSPICGFCFLMNEFFSFPLFPWLIFAIILLILHISDEAD